MCGENRHPKCDVCSTMACVKFFAVSDPKFRYRKDFGFKYSKDCWDKLSMLNAIEGKDPVSWLYYG